ncbi:hypothetical protein BGZ76_002950 [Entomortierella beljakovae]|nr:hypothetical protein BGZ76_002950 [Entomortierella beljakovae]
MDKPEGWSKTADDYVHWAHAFTLPHAQKAIEVTPVSTKRKPLRFLDVACGTGVVTETLAQKYPDPKDAVILSTDFAQGMVDHVEANKQQHQWKNVETKVMDATALDLPDASMDGIYCIFGVMLIPACDKALSEMHRVLEDGGSISIATWHHQDIMPIFVEATGEINALTQGSESTIEPSKLPSGMYFGAPSGISPPKTWMDLDFCIEKVESAGFKDVKGFQYDGVFKIFNIKEYMVMMVRNPGFSAVVAKWNPDQIQQFQDLVVKKVINKWGDKEEYTMNVSSNIVYGRK